MSGDIFGNKFALRLDQNENNSKSCSREDTVSHSYNTKGTVFTLLSCFPQAFKTSDGHVLIGAGNDGLFKKLCKVSKQLFRTIVEMFVNRNRNFFKESMEFN